LDANALFLPFLGGTDLAGEVGRLVDRPRIGVPRSVLDELRRLEMRGEPHAREVLELAARFPVVPNSGKGDAAILGLAVPGDIVVTADRELQRQLAARGVDVLAPRDRARLERRRGERPRAPRPARARGNG
jgi:rRNA-processing protein FCF1